ncbi:hypothetical protein GCM10010435_00670 [Winogradskya consettensis]|uniref:Uncharacterized protein n=1 Tax=Winogradskya consettensis TaxID=113560 RepID=A0A919S9Y6_9ACTN|nr:hypothetical protein [Actinoplanes consettensis]GIM66503.1 hypothetical protein Aco04nite_02280 [Actinoplanes consettensis]
MSDGYAHRSASQRRKLGRSALAHSIAVVAFGLLAWSGAAALDDGVPSLAASSLIAGSGGFAGALALTLTILIRLSSSAVDRAGSLQAARRVMVICSVAAFAAGVVLAPGGEERGFAISVSGMMAGTLALFALLAGGGLPARQRRGR